MNPLILNREECFGAAQRILNRDFKHPDDGWYQIEARGVHPHKPLGLVQILDEPACQSIVNRFNAEAEKPDFAGMLIDHEHFKHDPDKESVAYGWLQRLQNRDDGIYGQIRWTGTGQKAVDHGDYRFFSTEYDPGEVTILNRGESPKRIRPMRLDGLTLTNDNRNKGQKPITNREGETAPPQKAKQMKTVCTLLALSADASEEAVHAEVAKLIKNRNDHDAAIATITNRATKAETELKVLQEGQVETDLELYKNRFDPKQRDFMKSLLITNRASTIEFLKTAPELKGATAPARLHNRAVAKPVDANAGGDGVDEQELSAKRCEAVDQYKITNRCSHSQATEAVRRKSPELFGLPKRS